MTHGVEVVPYTTLPDPAVPVAGGDSGLEVPAVDLVLASVEEQEVLEAVASDL